MSDPIPILPGGYPDGAGGAALQSPQRPAFGLQGPVGPDGAAVAAAGAGAPTGEKAKLIEDTSNKSLSGAEAQPCVGCDSNQPYSIAFEIMTACGLAPGMYYTVWLKKANHAYTGELDEHGLTARYYSDNSDETAYVYLGHRLADDKYPESQSTDADKQDEAPLANSQLGPVSEKRLKKTNTKRLWKPWTVSDAYSNALRGAEEPHPSPYASVEGGTPTIGIGHKITPAEQRSGRFTSGPFAAPLSNDKMRELQNEDIANNGGNLINQTIKVPLYNYEYDALIDLGFNGGRGAVSSDSASLFDSSGQQQPPGTDVQNLGTLLNRGRYDLAQKFFSNHYNTSKFNGHPHTWLGGVQNRRDMDSRMFGNEPDGYVNTGTHHGTHYSQ